MTSDDCAQSSPEPPGSRLRRWLLVICLSFAVLVVIAVLILAAVFSTVRGVTSPSLGPLPDRADAVVVFAGESRRHEFALELMNDGLAPVIVISFGGQYRALEGVCGQKEPFEVLCPEPAEESTLSEARMFGEMASRNRWRSVVGVTSDYHVQRARTLLRRCHSGPLVFVAPPPGSVSDSIIRRETLGGLHARFATWSC